MADRWALEGIPVTPDEAVAELRARIGDGRLETWLTGPSGRSLALITNTERAMVMVFDGEGDPGAHAITPDASGRSAGYVLANGQDDEYPDTDTVPLSQALRIVRRVLTTGVPPPDTRWQVDR